MVYKRAWIRPVSRLCYPAEGGGRQPADGCRDEVHAGTPASGIRYFKACRSSYFQSIYEDIYNGYIQVYPLGDNHAIRAVQLMDALGEHALRSLDAIHLAIALEIRAPIVATADQVMATAAMAHGFEVVLIGRR